MADLLSPERRSANMSRIRSKGSVPEITVRQMAHQLGFRFRLHQKDLPGRPDLVFPRLRKIVFVHGCFWHQHQKCREGRIPASNRDYWAPKLERTQVRDRRAMEMLEADGWRLLTIWECELEQSLEWSERLREFLAE
jgi:DNA mismatch endonuclease, patch repair protein